MVAEPVSVGLKSTVYTKRVKIAPSWLVFTVLRVLAFVAPLAILRALGVEPLVAAVFSALIGLSLSIVFLSGQRMSLASKLYHLRHPATPRAGRDSDSEDAAIAGARSPSPNSSGSESEGDTKNESNRETGTAREA